MHVSRAISLGVVVGLAMILLRGPLFTVASAALAPPPAVSAAFSTYFHVRILAAPFALINYALLGWFYGRAAATTGMALQILIHGVNIALNILFVFGFGWGVMGAALGTVLGEASAALVGLLLVARHFGGLRPTLAMITPAELFDAAALKRMLGLSRDLMIRSIALMGAYAWFAAQGSRSGEIVLSANAILLNFLMVSGFFLDGLAQAAEQLCGKSIGANWRPAFDRAFRLAMRWGLLIGAVLTGLWFFGGPLLIDFMTTNAEVRALARQYLWLAALTSLSGMPAFVLDGVLVGATLNHTMRNGMVTAFAIYLGAALLLQPLWGNTGLWVAIHTFFIARATYFWIAVERRKPGLFLAPGLAAGE